MNPSRERTSILFSGIVLFYSTFSITITIECVGNEIPNDFVPHSYSEPWKRSVMKQTNLGSKHSLLQCEGSLEAYHSPPIEIIPHLTHFMSYLAS